MESRNDISVENESGGKAFRLIVITSPHFLDGEAAMLEGLLEKGLTKLHMRKPGAKEEEIGDLLSRLSPACHSRLVLHGNRSLADKFGIPQIHCPLNVWKTNIDLQGNREPQGHGDLQKCERAISFSTSLHSWKEVKGIGKGIAYAFMSPLFDSISKKGYKANAALWQSHPGDYKGAEKDLPLIGLGGINKELLPLVIRGGWAGAAMLGCIWEEPKLAMQRFVELQDLIGGYRADKGKY